MKSLGRPAMLSWGIALAVVAVDQVVKTAVGGWIGRGQAQHVHWLVGDWLGFAYAENTGVAFGLLRGRSTVVLLIAAIAILLAVSAFVHAWRDKPTAAIGGGLVIGGAIGNVVDRARFGFVRDFVAIGPWPSFNVADAAVTCGVMLIVLGMTATNGFLPRREDGCGRVGKQIMETPE